MPIRTQNPWVDAGAGINNGIGQLVQMYAQLPQVRAQMQQHADQLGIQQGKLMLDAEDQATRAPVYAAQTANYNASASKEQAAAQQLVMLMQLAKQAQQGKYQEQMAGFSGAPTITNAQQMANSSMLGALAGSSALQPDAAQRALASEQAPLKLNMGQTAFSREGIPFAEGSMSAPYGNTLFRGMQLGGGESPTVLQQGQFRPAHSQLLDPSTIIKNQLGLITAVDQGASTTPEQEELAKVLLTKLLQSATGQTNAPTVGGGGSSKIKSIKQIR